MFQATEQRERIQVEHSSLTELMRQRLEHREAKDAGRCGQDTREEGARQRMLQKSS